MRRYRRRKIIWFGSAIAILILVVLFLFWIRPGKRLINPALNSVSWIGEKLDNMRNSFNDKQSLIEQNEELKQRIIKLSADSAKLSVCQSENNIFRKQLDFFENEEYNFLTGRVIGKLSSLAGMEEVYVFNRGSRDGVARDYPLVFANSENNQGFLIGKIIKADPARSYFILNKNFHNSVAGTVINAEEESACLVSGTRDGVIKLEYLPVNRELNQGDLVITSGLEEYIPRGLIIGEVGYFENNDGALFYDANIDPFVTADDLNILSVILSNNEIQD